MTSSSSSSSSTMLKNLLPFQHNICENSQCNDLHPTEKPQEKCVCIDITTSPASPTTSHDYHYIHYPVDPTTMTEVSLQNLSAAPTSFVVSRQSPQPQHDIGLNRSAAEKENNDNMQIFNNGMNVAATTTSTLAKTSPSSGTVDEALPASPSSLQLTTGPGDVVQAASSTTHVASVTVHNNHQQAISHLQNQPSMHHHNNNHQHHPSIDDNNAIDILSPSYPCSCGRPVEKDSNIVSGDDDDNVITSQRKGHHLSREKKTDLNFDSNGIEVYSDEADSGVKMTTTDGCCTSEEEGPPLPPRPPPRPRNMRLGGRVPHSTGVKKYVVWCLICGGFSCLLGIMFLTVYFLLRSYTRTIGYFETVPTFVPATLLILTGICIISLARRRNRYSYLIKLSGACGLLSALTCALVTVTTTVLHLSRLQSLKECEYTQKTRTCTCYSDMIDPQMGRNDDGVKLVFDSTTDCGVVHGALYSCLRAIFGLSVAGVLIAVFCCMLVYQLLSHERKKMYWEQLELRCRSMYASQQVRNPHQQQQTHPLQSNNPLIGTCRCYEQCHLHLSAGPAVAAMPPPSHLHPHQHPHHNQQPHWETGGDGSRFWAGSNNPNPPGNFYSPNPGTSGCFATANALAGIPGSGIISFDCNAENERNRVTNQNRSSGWSWPRMPWKRANNNTTTNSNNSGTSNNIDSHAECMAVATPDSQYGFSATGNVLPYGVWGPPPPYSDPNSPARRAFYHCRNMMHHSPAGRQISECHQIMNSSSTDSQSIETCCPQDLTKQVGGGVGDGEIVNSAVGSSTLPKRKLKKRNNVDVGQHQHQQLHHQQQHPVHMAQRPIVQNLFPQQQLNSNSTELKPEDLIKKCHHNVRKNSSSVTNSGFHQQQHQQHTQHHHHHGYMHPHHVHANNPHHSHQHQGSGVDTTDSNGDGPPESEVYFADVSSCCNENYYDDANRRIVNCKDCNSNEPAQPGRSRLPITQFGRLNNDNLNLPKDISRQSMVSMESGEKTDYTDLSPVTPDESLATTSDLIESFPSYNNEQSQGAFRRSTKEYTARESVHYEEIVEDGK